MPVIFCDDISNLYILNLNKKTNHIRKNLSSLEAQKQKQKPATNTIQRVLKTMIQQHNNNNTATRQHNKNNIMQNNKNKNKSISFTSMAGSFRDTQSGCTYSYDHKWIFLCLLQEMISIGCLTEYLKSNISLFDC